MQSHHVRSDELVSFGERRTAYGLAVAASGIVASFLFVLGSGPQSPDGERWEGLAIGWVSLGAPLVVASSIASAVFAYRLYVSCRSWFGVFLVFIANVLLTAALGVAGAHWASGL